MREARMAGTKHAAVSRERRALRLNWLGVRDGIRNYLITAA